MGKEVNQSRHLYGWLLACINKDCNWGGKLQNESSKNKNSNNKKKQQTNNERQIPNIGENAWDNLKFLLITQMTSFDSTSLLQYLLF